MASSRAKDLKRKKIIFGLVSTMTWIVTGITFAIIAFTKIKAKDSSGTPIFSQEIKTMITSIGVTAVIGLIVGIIIKDKIRTFVFMASTILATLIFKEVGMYIVLGIWLIDEYVLYALYRKFSRLYEIRKEVDLG